MAYDLWIDYTSGADPKQAVGWLQSSKHGGLEISAIFQ